MPAYIPLIIACVFLSACTEVVPNDDSSASSSSQAIVSSVSSASSRSSAPGVSSMQTAPTGFDPLATASRDIPASVDIPVPFTPQAPHANWNPPFDEACEESSLLMADFFLQGKTFTPEIADQQIRAMADWESKNGYAIDIPTEEVAEIARDYLGRQAKVYTGSDVTVENIKVLLAAGYPVIIPAAGQDLGNPYFSGDGPPYHMLVIRGYTRFGNFITNDPGTRRGEEYAYDQDLLVDVIHDWTGTKETIRQGKKAILVIEK